MGRPPFPTPDTLSAPPTWRCIDFVSDLHLHEGLPLTTAAFTRYLQSSPADALFILGDLFEAWVGDDMRAQPYEAACTQVLRSAGERLHLGIMVGNRDFVLGKQMLNVCAASQLIDPTVLNAWGQRYLLIHGDELCLADETYLRFRAQVRQETWQTTFLAHPLETRLAQAKRMRDASRAHQNQQMAEAWADVDEPTASEWMRAAGAQALIHGHTHKPQSQPYGGGMRHVLSDWDLDGEHPRAEVLRLSPTGIARITWR